MVMSNAIETRTDYEKIILGMSNLLPISLTEIMGFPFKSFYRHMVRSKNEAKSREKANRQNNAKGNKKKRRK